MASILIYNKSGGAFSNASNPPTETIGNCAYVVNNPDNYNQSADLSEHLFFVPQYSSSSLSVTPYPFTADGAFSTALSPISLSSSSGSGQSLVMDSVNHIVFALNSSSSSGGSVVTQVTGIPYASAGFTSSGVSTGLSFSNDTINSCTSGSRCNYGLVAVLN